MDLTFNKYQKESGKTNICPGEISRTAVADRLNFAVHGLSGEAGEVAQLISKAIRDDSGEISEERRKSLFKEIGDVLWYTQEICTVLGFNIGSVAEANIDKLKDREKTKIRLMLQGYPHSVEEQSILTHVPKVLLGGKKKNPRRAHYHCEQMRKLGLNIGEKVKGMAALFSLRRDVGIIGKSISRIQLSGSDLKIEKLKA